ncbi:MAG: PDZ domain-containing protein [Fimbriimonadaceae bacterium]
MRTYLHQKPRCNHLKNTRNKNAELETICYVRPRIHRFAHDGIAGVCAGSPKDQKNSLKRLRKEAIERLELTPLRASVCHWGRLQRIQKLIANQPDVEKAKTPGEFTSAINKALETYKFSHIAVFPPEYGQQRMTGTRAGIGIRIQDTNGEEIGLTVTHVFADSPASDAGIQAGDLVIAADGKDVHSVAELQGDKRTKIQDHGNAQRRKKDFEVVRRDYSTVIPETLAWHGKTAVITIPTFDQGYSQKTLTNSCRRQTKKRRASLSTSAVTGVDE